MDLPCNIYNREKNLYRRRVEAMRRLEGGSSISLLNREEILNRLENGAVMLFDETHQRDAAEGDHFFNTSGLGQPLRKRLSD